MDLKIINDMYNLLKWYCTLLQSFPRNHRYGLGLRIENTLYDIHKRLLEARFSTSKEDILKTINLDLETSRFLVRLCFDLKLISQTQHHAFIEQIDNIGKQLGGWIKSQKANV